jgi:hypothetical protein
VRKYPPIGAAAADHWVTVVAAPNWHFCAAGNRQSMVTV